MIRFNVSIEGVTPLLCNRFQDGAAMEATERTRKVAPGGVEESPHEIAEAKLYTSEKTGKHIIPSPNLLACIMGGGRFYKVSRRTVTTQRRSMIPAAVTISPIELEIDNKQPWAVDTRPVRNPSTGGRILCHRPIFDDWKLKFELLLEESIIGQKLLRQIVDSAGNMVGLGDYRPDTKGPYGRFVVTNWKVIK